MITESDLREEMSHIELAPSRREEALSYLVTLLVTSGELSLGRAPKVTLCLRHKQSVFLALGCLSLLYDYHPEFSFSGDKPKSRTYDVELPVSISHRLLVDSRLCREHNGKITYPLGAASMRWLSDKAFCGALYLECGRLYTGEDYRLDLVLSFDDHRLEELDVVLRRYDVRYSVSCSQDKQRLTIRREAVAGFLALIGANACALAVTEYYFERNVKRAVTRTINCSTNNMDKAYKAATYQLWAIGVLKNKGVYNLLPRETRQVGDARIANPEATLQQIADGLGLNKTAVYRHMKVITDTAEKHKGE